MVTSGVRRSGLLASGVGILTLLLACVPTASADPAGAASAADAINNYWQNIRAGKVDDAMTYIDTFAMADIAAGPDASVTREQRESAAKDLQGFLGIAYKQPQVLAAMKTSEVRIKSEKPTGDGQTTVIDYVVKVKQPATELENTAYVRKGPGGWRIVDTKQPGQQRLTETLRTGWTNSHQKLPQLTFDQYVNMMTSTMSRRASSGGGAATTKPPR